VARRCLDLSDRSRRSVISEVAYRQVVCFLAMILAAAAPGCGERTSSGTSPTSAAPGSVRSGNMQVPDRIAQSQVAAPGENVIEKSPGQPLPEDWFEDVTTASGIDFRYRNGQEGGLFYILETLGGGAALLDYDRDGDLEIFLTGGGTISSTPPRVTGLPSAFFRNEGRLRFADVTTSARLETPGDYSHGCFATDFDCDGYADILVTAYGRCRLFQNLGDGTFSDVSTIAKLESPGWWTAAAWGDIDRDGLPDLFVTGYLKWSPEKDQPCLSKKKQREVCGPNRYHAADDRVYRNRGDGTFEDVSQPIGLLFGGNGLGVVAADINSDSLLDFYVANDETDNFLYLGGSVWARRREHGRRRG
jgi:hypothetical protein